MLQVADKVVQCFFAARSAKNTVYFLIIPDIDGMIESEFRKIEFGIFHQKQRTYLCNLIT
jgi:hypothetical protein